ncbi:unnamed protein product [Parnassius mnemosyne]|uniref:RNA methyltransferase n=1 Tax=Parnassius mnemosyne TaxID=213953 RepID=A0AAV1M640_9NEOP
MAIVTEELSYCGQDPGAAKFGNFINYYSFHEANQRIQNLHTSMFPKLTVSEDIVCLDIGCNTGELTKEVYDYLKYIYPKSKINFLGIDIDPVLIQRAQEHTNINNITFITLNITNKQDQDIVQRYLNSHNKTKFDIVFCFSVTMWIHLNNGDEKFLDFLKYITKYAKTIIIEPQPWKCYRNAQRRLKKSGSYFPLYESLKLRSSVETVIENTITSYGFTKVYESLPSKWNRKILSFLIR